MPLLLEWGEEIDLSCIGKWSTWEVAQPTSMRAPWSSGSCSSCPHPDPSLHRAVLQQISIQNTILVHHPAATVHQHNLHYSPCTFNLFLWPDRGTAPTSPQFLPPTSALADNTQSYPGQRHFLTGTHIAMKAASCKIDSLHPQAVTLENQMVECSTNIPGLYAWAIHKGENILHNQRIEHSLLQWELATTTTMLSNIDIL